MTNPGRSPQADEQPVDLDIPSLDGVGAGDRPGTGLDPLHIGLEPAHIVTPHPTHETVGPFPYASYWPCAQTTRLYLQCRPGWDQLDTSYLSKPAKGSSCSASS